jgi:multicomponent Na+:H+ antiporter subunit B
VINISLLMIMVATALGLVWLRNLLAVVMFSGIFSLTAASLWVVLGAVDVAFTEASVGAGIATVLGLASLALTRTEHEKRTRVFHLPALIVVLVTGAALIYGTLDMPGWGDPDAPIHTHVAPRYIEDSLAETGVPNIVTSVLASYRGFDTLGETTVIFTAGVGVLVLLGRGRRYPVANPRVAAGGGPGRAPAAPGSEGAAVPGDSGEMRFKAILRVGGKLLIPPILLFAFYTQAHGELGPGGGFQAGVIFASAFILYALLFGVPMARAVAPASVLRGTLALGVLIYAGVGIAGVLLGGNYLDYSVLAHDPVHGQELGIILIELGVGITVASAMMTVFFVFAGQDPQQVD